MSKERVQRAKAETEAALEEARRVTDQNFSTLKTWISLVFWKSVAFLARAVTYPFRKPISSLFAALYAIGIIIPVTFYGAMFGGVLFPEISNAYMRWFRNLTDTWADWSLLPYFVGILPVSLCYLAIIGFLHDWIDTKIRGQQ